ncbi:hypothetical protein ACW9KT_15620 [Hymenobacter sp. HD11105]
MKTIPLSSGEKPAATFAVELPVASTQALLYALSQAVIKQQAQIDLLIATTSVILSEQTNTPLADIEAKGLEMLLENMKQANEEFSRVIKSVDKR